MLTDPETFRKAYEKATLKEIIKERDRLIREIRRYEKGKIPEEDYCKNSDPDVIYLCINSYLAELFYLIEEKTKSLIINFFT